MIKFIDGIYYRKRIAAGKTYVKILHGNYFYQHYIDAHHTDFNQQERNTYQKQGKTVPHTFFHHCNSGILRMDGKLPAGYGRRMRCWNLCQGFSASYITWTETAYIHMRISTGYTWWHISAPSHIWYIP